MNPLKSLWKYLPFLKNALKCKRLQYLMFPFLFILSACFEPTSIQNSSTDDSTFTETSVDTTSTLTSTQSDESTQTSIGSTSTQTDTQSSQTNTDESTDSQTQTHSNNETSTATDSVTDTQAQTDSNTDTQTDTQLELTAKQLSGEAHFLENCAGCHGALGDGGQAGQSSILHAVENLSFVNKTTITMPPADPNKCTNECADDINHWLSAIHNIDIGLNETDSNTDTQTSTDPIESYSISNESRADTYRRASILLGHGVPSEEKLNELQGINNKQLKDALKELMQGEAFRHFIKDAANDQLLVRSLATNDFRFYFLNYYPRYFDLQAANENRFVFENELRDEFREEPLELINYVIQNDLPYSEILTADYTMISDEMSKLYGTPEVVMEDQWVVGHNTGQNISTLNPMPSKDWANSTTADIPHVGVLSSIAYLNQNPSTSTNRNRARSRWTMYHFIGYDIEASAPRVKIEDATDADNPTLNNPACVVCHVTMDPIAAAFQNFSDKGLYKIGPKGLDSLSKEYRRSDLYVEGQTWYADVLPAGYDHQQMPQGEAPLRYLAQQLVQDDRFGSGVIKFWWPAIFGNRLYETQSNEELNAQLEFVSTTAQRFKNNNWDFKLLLTDLFMSKWYRAQNLNKVSDQSIEPPITFNGSRLLTPEEMANKTQGLFDNTGEYLTNHYSAFGGIDSIDVTSRDRNMNVVKMNVTKANAYKQSCSIVFQEFESPIDERRLFTDVELTNIPGTLGLKTSSISDGSDINTVINATLNAQNDYELNVFFNEGDALLTHLKIWALDGSNVIFDDNPVQIENSSDISIQTNAAISAGSYRIQNKYKSIKIIIPNASIESGDYRIKMTHSSRQADNQSALTFQLSSLADSEDFDDANSTLVKQQLVTLFDRLVNEQYDIDDTQIIQAFELYNQLLTNAKNRAEVSLFGDDYLCNGESNDQTYDLFYSFSAWKGIIVALSTDHNFISE